MAEEKKELDLSGFDAVTAQEPTNVEEVGLDLSGFDKIQEAPSKFESGFFGLAKGAGGGLFQIVEAGSKAVRKAIMEGKTLEEGFKEGLRESNDFFKKQMEANPDTFKTAEFAGLLGSPVTRVIPGGALMKGAGLGALYQGAEEESIGGAIKGGAAGLAGGALGLGAQKFGGKLVTKIAGELSENAAKMAAKVFKSTPTEFSKKIKFLPGKTFSQKTKGLGEFIIKNDLLKESMEESLVQSGRIAKEAGKGLETLMGKVSDELPRIKIGNVQNQIKEQIYKKLIKSKDPAAMDMMRKISGLFDEFSANEEISLAGLNEFRKNVIDQKIPWQRMAREGADQFDNLLLKTRAIVDDIVKKNFEKGSSKLGKDGLKQLQNLRKTFQYARTVEDMAAKRVPREFLQPEIQSKDLFTGMILEGMIPSGKLAKGAAALGGAIGGGLVRKAGRKGLSTAYKRGEAFLRKPPAAVKPPRLFPTAAIMTGKELQE